MRDRGFSLIELLVAMAVSLIAVAAGVVILIGSQRSFQSGKDDRGMQETARVALDELGTNLRQAGYGLEPTFAFDMGLIANTVQDRLPAGVTARFGGYSDLAAPNCGTTCRDSVTGPDELVFYARDPLFERNVAAVSQTTLTLAVPAVPAVANQLTLLPGQILQVMCYGTNNQWLWAYVTVASATVGSSQIQVALKPGRAYEFPYQNALLAQTCFSGGTSSVRAFKIDRFHYYVAAVDDAGNVQPWETAGTRPYLLLDQGLTDQDGNPLVTAIAPDVEDLQVAYVFPMAANQILGANETTAVLANTAQDDTGFNLDPTGSLAGIPSFSQSSLATVRTTHHPANIRAVRIAITVRSPRADLSVPDAVTYAQVPAALNRPAVAGEAGYRRMVFDTTVATQNLTTRFPVFPVYDGGFPTACCASDDTSCTSNGNCGGG